MSDPFELVFIEPTHATPGPHGPLQLGRRAAPGQLEQISLTFGRSHAGERPYFGEREFSLRHRRADLGEFRERPGGTHLLTGRAQIDPGTEGEPMGARSVASRLPPAEPVELGDQCEESVGGSVQVSRQSGDLVTQTDESVQLVVDLPIIGAAGVVRGPFRGNVHDVGDCERSETHKNSLICKNDSDLP